MTRMRFDEAVEFVMERLAVPAPAQRATRDKVRKRIRYGLGDGSLPRLDVQTLDMDRDALIYWARTKWPGKFNIPITIPGALSDEVKLTATTQEQVLPSDIAACHTLLQHSRFVLQALEAKCRAQEQVIAELRPLAEQYRRNQEKNRQSARKPRNQ